MVLHIQYILQYILTSDALYSKCLRLDVLFYFISHKLLFLLSCSARAKLITLSKIDQHNFILYIWIAVRQRRRQLRAECFLLTYAPVSYFINRRYAIHKTWLKSKFESNFRGISFHQFFDITLKHEWEESQCPMPISFSLCTVYYLSIYQAMPPV